MTDTAPRRIDYLPLAELKPAPRNPKDHADEDMDASIARFGIVESQVMDERTGRLVSGHGRLDALQRAEAAGGTPPDGVIVDDDGTWLVPVQRGWRSRNKKEAEAALVAVNAIGPKGGWIPDMLAEMLADVSTTRAGLTGVGYEQHDLDAMLAELHPNDVEPPPFEPITDDEQPRLDEREPHQCPSCGFRWRYLRNRQVKPVTDD